MTEALITELSKIGSLRVTSRTSVMQYKTAPKPLPEIARDLNVEVIVAGSVQRSGDKIGITAQLIRAATDQNIWANQYERDLRDVLSLQREVARAIAREINISLTPKEKDLLASARPVNPEALDAYLKGRDYFNRGSNVLGQPQGPDLVKKGIAYFEQAVKIDPEYGSGYAGLAAANGILAINGGTEFRLPAKEAVRRALQIDENLAEPHETLALLMLADWDWSGAEAEFKRSIELNPSAPRGGYAIYLMGLGRFNDAIREIELSQELDPLSLLYKATADTKLDRKVAIKLLPADSVPNEQAKKRLIREAKAAAKLAHPNICAIHEVGEADGQSYTVMQYVEGETLASRLHRKPLGLPEALDIATQTERDQSLAWLGRAYELRSSWIPWLKVEPKFDPLHSDPCFTDLLRRVNLAP